MMKKTLALLLGLTLCFTLSACQSGDDADASASPSESADPSESESAGAEESAAIEADLTQTLYEFSSGLKDGDTAITVDGVAIPNEIYFYWLASNCYMMDYQYSMYGISADFTDADTASSMVEYAQSSVVYTTALEQLCEENGVTVTDEQKAELQAQIDETLESESFTMEDLLRGYGLNEDDFFRLHYTNFLYENLEAALVEEPTDADLEQYAEDIGAFSCKHILLLTSTEDETDEDGNVTATAEEHNAAQLALAQDLLAQIQAAEDPAAKLDELMNEYSEDGRDEDGALYQPDGYTFTDEDSLVDGFREATLALEVGEISDIVETDYGYHIILRLPVDVSQYHDEYMESTLEAIISARTETAEVEPATELESVNVSDFYQRYLAWTDAFYSQFETSTEEE